MKKRKLLLSTTTLIAITFILYIIFFPKTKAVTGDNISIAIDHIPSQKVACIGQIDLKENINYRIQLSVKSGNKIFVALSSSANIVDAQGEMWKQYYETMGKDLEHTFTDIEKGGYYVYVGTKGEPLENIEGELSIKKNR